MTPRIFARTDLDTTSPVIEFADLEAAEEARGGGGDEIFYSVELDQFSFAIGSGINDAVTVSNPRPGAPLIEAARVVVAMAEVAWPA